MEIQIKAYAYTIDIITEIRYFCKCNKAVLWKFCRIFTCVAALIYTKAPAITAGASSHIKLPLRFA